MKKLLRAVPFIVLAGVYMAGCAGEDGENGLTGAAGPQGPEGPQGPQGPAGENWQAWAWVGNNGASCYTCHQSKVTEWQTTGHPDAFQLLVTAGEDDNPYCLQCHTLGWDAPVAQGDTSVTDHGLDFSGYDDFWPAADAEDTARLHALEGVQCESCHSSMGPGMYDHSPEISLATSPNEGGTAACATCHAGQLAEWTMGAHDFISRTGETIDDFTAEWNRTSCWECHGAQGFLAANDPDYAGSLPGAVLNQVGCVTCHDPHNATNAIQLRNVTAQEVVYNPNTPEISFTDRGNSQLCVQCHHARRDAANVEGQVHGTGTLRGPHESPQMDMFLGTGCFEIAGRTYDRGSESVGHKSISDGNGCVACHMEIETSPTSGAQVRNHSFEPTTTACQLCHPGLADFNFNNGQTDIAALMGQIEAFFGVPGDSLSSTTYTGAPYTSAADSMFLNPVYREAVYGYLFVKNDASLGVHNPTYANSVLQNALLNLN